MTPRFGPAIFGRQRGGEVMLSRSHLEPEIVRHSGVRVQNGLLIDSRSRCSSVYVYGSANEKKTVSESWSKV